MRSLSGGDQLRDAATAIGQEYREGSRWKRLHCHKVSVFSERDRGTIFVVHIGRSVEFDWTWEGAKAFCPQSLGQVESSSDRFHEEADEEADNEDETVWSGEIVEVDERNGCLFITLDNLELIPTVGAFFVRPFEFLSVLDAVYNGDEFKEVQSLLPSRLEAAMGGIHPMIDEPRWDAAAERSARRSSEPDAARIVKPTAPIAQPVDAIG
jgi:hypothetical protein